MKVGGSLQKTIATCSKCETNLILAYLHRSQRHSSSQSQKCYSAILSDKSKFLLRISSTTDFIFLTQCLGWYPAEKAFLTWTVSEQKTIYTDWLSCSLAVHFRKAFQQGSIGQHCVGPKFLFTDEMFGSNLFLSDKIEDSRFCDWEDESLRDQLR